MMMWCIRRILIKQWHGQNVFCNSSVLKRGHQFFGVPQLLLGSRKSEPVSIPYCTFAPLPISSNFNRKKEMFVIANGTAYNVCRLIRHCKKNYEALTAMKMALKFKNMNNLDKAQKLFQLAIALSPNHPEILLEYGEFLEFGKDFINADFFYLKALKGPENSRAMANRRRVLPVVNHLDSEELKRIDSKQQNLTRLDEKDDNLKRTKKELYFQHIHHTVAIEGNTMSLEETRAVIEKKKPVSGKSILEYNEILSMDVALRYLNQTLANKEDITVFDILAIHKRAMGHVDHAGTFRKIQVYVGDHVPPAASDVEVLMEEFVALLQSPRIRNMHPIHIAALAHNKLAFIHPFVDGNGRTARLIMNWLFIRYGYPLIIIKKEDSPQYYKVLEIADEGDIRPFYRFIAHSTENTIDAILFPYDPRP